MIWVMGLAAPLRRRDRALSDNDLYRVRGVGWSGSWTVRLYKRTTRIKSPEGGMRAVILMGIDDVTGLSGGRCRTMRVRTREEVPPWDW